MPYSRKTGRRYAAGSHATPEFGFPNTCTECGERIYTSRQSFVHHTDDLTGLKTARHIPSCPASVTSSAGEAA